MPRLLFDNVELMDGARVTQSGYVVGNARVARTGIQIYRGVEVGRPEMDFVRVYRPPEEVFSRDSMHSFAHRPITNDHPGDMISADNWHEFSVGHTGEDVARDGETIRVPMVLMDATAVKAWKDGKRELSMGYFADLNFEDGVTPKGEAYDAVQRGIRANHLALVKAARGGTALRLDSRETDMTLRAITVDGIECQMTDTACQVVQRAMSALADKAARSEKDLIAANDDLTKARKALADATEEARKQTESRDGQIAALKKQVEDASLTPAKIDAAVAKRIALVTEAKRILGDKLVVDGKSDIEICRQVAADRMGAEAVKDRSDEYIRACFDTICAGTARGHDRLADALGSRTGGNGSARMTDSDKAYDSYLNDLQNAWKTPIAKPAA